MFMRKFEHFANGRIEATSRRKFFKKWEQELRDGGSKPDPTSPV